DEGVKTCTKVLAEDGVLMNHMHSRETAHIFGVEPNAGMRVMTFEYSPLIRMSNTFIGGGDWKPEEIIEDTKKGIYVSTRKDNSIDDKRYNWTISAQEGWMIEDGELTTHLKDVTVNGIAPKLFASIDAVGTDLEIKPIIGCGKGMQMLYTGNGGPHMRGVADIVGG
ncbi:TldD/PmbA family protein, partial [Candidatus Bathyarchaeota archaeon]|nr:TldD/PmbA family protein [Candidatus Bathyarchaeota archaeon]